MCVIVTPNYVNNRISAFKGKLDLQVTRKVIPAAQVFIQGQKTTLPHRENLMGRRRTKNKTALKVKKKKRNSSVWVGGCIDNHGQAPSF